ncbi:MAG TPA: phosphatase PAP2 family protein [Gemmatimonadales bacterium]|nr:phosphatase PAP2 family protein [Gemmatimonadales bacterium]
MLAHPFAIPIIVFLALWTLFYLPLAGVAGLAKGAARKASGWVAGTRFGKWTTGRRDWHGLRTYAPLAVVLLLGALAAVAAATLFVEVAQRVQDSGSVVYHLDRSAHQWFVRERQSGVTTLLRTVTFFGGGSGIALVVGIVTALLLAGNERAWAGYLLGTAAGGMLLNSALKLVFARARPDLASAAAVGHWYSFPSGHAMESFIVYGAMAFITLRQPWPWKVDSAVLALVVTMVILIGLSRVYLGVHWLSDIAGGWSAGTVWLVAATVAFDLLFRMRTRRRSSSKPA